MIRTLEEFDRKYLPSLLPHPSPQEEVERIIGNFTRKLQEAIQPSQPH